MVFIAEQNKKLHVSAYIGHHQFFTTSLLKSLDIRLFNKEVVKTWWWPIQAETCSSFVLFCYINTIILAILLLCFWRKFSPSYSLNTQRGWQTSELRISILKPTRCNKVSNLFYFGMAFYMLHAVAQLVVALGYEPKGRGFDSRWCHLNFSLT